MNVEKKKLNFSNNLFAWKALLLLFKKKNLANHAKYVYWRLNLSLLFMCQVGALVVLSHCSITLNIYVFAFI